MCKILIPVQLEALAPGQDVCASAVVWVSMFWISVVQFRTSPKV